VKFLVDNQLPAALARQLSAQGLTAMHILDCGLDFDALLPKILDALNAGIRVVEVR
jgi:predicted nuclease of predicted toxin-antitoxin system